MLRECLFYLSLCVSRTDICILLKIFSFKRHRKLHSGVFPVTYVVVEGNTIIIIIIIQCSIIIVRQFLHYKNVKLQKSLIFLEDLTSKSSEWGRLIHNKVNEFEEQSKSDFDAKCDAFKVKTTAPIFYDYVGDVPKRSQIKLAT